MSVIRAERQTVVFFEGLEVDGYRMPDGEFRVGVTGASTVVGYAKMWLSRSIDRDSRVAKSLQGMDFTGTQIEVSASREGRSGASKVKTISLRDFSKVISYAAAQGKKAAVALQSSLWRSPPAFCFDWGDRGGGMAITLSHFMQMSLFIQVSMSYAINRYRLAGFILLVP